MCRSCQALIDPEVGRRAEDATLHHTVTESIHWCISSYIFSFISDGTPSSLCIEISHSILKYIIPFPSYSSVHPVSQRSFIPAMTALVQSLAPVKPTEGPYFSSHWPHRRCVCVCVCMCVFVCVVCVSESKREEWELSMCARWKYVFFF